MTSVVQYVAKKEKWQRCVWKLRKRDILAWRQQKKVERLQVSVSDPTWDICLGKVKLIGWQITAFVQNSTILFKNLVKCKEDELICKYMSCFMEGSSTCPVNRPQKPLPENDGCDHMKPSAALGLLFESWVYWVKAETREAGASGACYFVNLWAVFFFFFFKWQNGGRKRRKKRLKQEKREGASGKKEWRIWRFMEEEVTVNYLWLWQGWEETCPSETNRSRLCLWCLLRFRGDVSLFDDVLALLSWSVGIGLPTTHRTPLPSSVNCCRV